MRNELQQQIGPIVIANVEQLYAWSNDGGIAASDTGAGYSHQKLTPKKLTCFDPPVSILEHFDFDSADSSFPVLMELKNRALCDRSFLAFEHVRAIHFRDENELQAYSRFPTPTFGMSEIELCVSPSLFEGMPDGEPIENNQAEFDLEKYRDLERLAGSIIFVLRARETNELGTAFAHSLLIDHSSQLPPLLQAMSDYRWKRKQPNTTIGKFVFSILEFTAKNQDRFRSIDSESSAIDWSESLLELTKNFDNLVPENMKPPSDRFKGMASILNSSNTLKELSDSTNSFQVFQYAILITLMRRDSKAFDHWLSTATTNCEEVRLAAAFLMGFRCERRSVLDRKLRNAELDKILVRAISESMLDSGSMTLRAMSLDVASPLRQQKITKQPISVTQADSNQKPGHVWVLSGKELLGINFDQISGEEFSLTISARELKITSKSTSNDAQRSDSGILNSVDEAKPQDSKKRVISDDKSTTKSRRKKVGEFAIPETPLLDESE